MRRPAKILLASSTLFGILALAGTALTQTPGDPLAEGFKTPPDSAKPRAWWHWTAGNVTKEGITKDLEWMKHVGIGGMMMADGSSGSGQTLPDDKKIVFFTPEWFDALHHAAAEADRLGLEMSIFSSAGWSETGGPWVKPEGAMKKLVWSQTDVQGPKSFEGKLTAPPSNNGPFQDMGAGRPTNDPTFYADSAVLAYPTPEGEMPMADLHPKVSSSDGGDAESLAGLMDGNFSTAASIGAPETGGPAWVQYEFPEPIAARAVTLVASGRGIPFGRIAVSDDGKAFRTLVDLPGPIQYRAAGMNTYAFPATKAKIFRVEMTQGSAQPGAVMSQAEPQPAGSYALNEFTVFTGARVDHWEEKAVFNFIYDYESAPTPSVPAASAIPLKGVVDLTSKMDKDGTLHWDVPAGKWTIMRMGYSLTGSKNHPAVPAGTGYEADKLNGKWMTEYYHGYFDPIEQALGPLFGKSLRYVMMDSWEAGMQNWTDDLVDQFKKRRGYDPTPYLPVLAGRVVESADASDRFTWDFRRTLNELFAEYHYGTMAEQLAKKGIGIYGEAGGVSMEFPEDTLLNKKQVAIPMGEFWVRALHPELQYYVDVRGAASASHAYGKTLVATESFTGGGYETPSNMKRIADYWFAQGVNRLVFHTSAQQPLDTKPGNTMVGMHMNRNITWAEEAKPVMTYFARNSYMLQQGLFVADLVYLLPEGAPSSQPFWGGGLQPAPPAGYDYDCVNDDVLLNRMKVGEDGRIMLPDGMSYRVLVLPQSQELTVPALRKIKELAEGGAIIVGPKPLTTPSLLDYPKGDEEVRALASEVWGDLDGEQRNVHYVGKGKVIWGMQLKDILASEKIVRDAEFGGDIAANPVWIHRRAGDTDIFFVASQADEPTHVQASLRVAGKSVELWHPDSGQIEPASYEIKGDRTIIPIDFDPRGSVFVVFRGESAAPSRAIASPATTTIASVSGPWDVSFPADLGAPPQIKLPELAPWSASEDEGVKYFSGTATYAKEIQADQAWFKPGARQFLDLGKVNDIAEVALNGKPVGELWKAPYKIDVTGALKPGANTLEVKVTNEWTNRIAGDRLAPADKKILSQDGARGGFGGGGRGGARGGGFGARAGARGTTGTLTGVPGGRGGARGGRAGAGGRGGFGGRGGAPAGTLPDPGIAPIGVAPAPASSGPSAAAGSAFGGPPAALTESGLLGPVKIEVQQAG